MLATVETTVATLTTLAMLGMLATDEPTVDMSPLLNCYQVFQVFANLSRSFRLSWLFKLFRLSCMLSLHRDLDNILFAKEL